MLIGTVLYFEGFSLGSLAFLPPISKFQFDQEMRIIGLLASFIKQGRFMHGCMVYVHYFIRT